MILLLLGCASAGLAPTGPSETLHQFAIEHRGWTFAGLAAVRIDGEKLDFQALSPVGLALFQVSFRGAIGSVQAPRDDWARVLEQIPFRRDLSLIYVWSCPEGRCDTDPGRLVERSGAGWTERRWRGPDGPASALLTAGRAVLTDPRRRYTLTLVDVESDGP